MMLEVENIYSVFREYLLFSIFLCDITLFADASFYPCYLNPRPDVHKINKSPVT